MNSEINKAIHTLAVKVVNTCNSLWRADWCNFPVIIARVLAKPSGGERSADWKKSCLAIKEPIATSASLLNTCPMTPMPFVTNFFTHWWNEIQYEWSFDRSSDCIDQIDIANTFRRFVPTLDTDSYWCTIVYCTLLSQIGAQYSSNDLHIEY